MASRKRTQEEKNLRTLRELASLPANKQCFDCHQRGPTYVNMTVGSFVCTSCSGMLRGLNPPHRVKSITMTVFTPEEIEFVRARGNDYCRHIWMGTHDARSALEPEARDEQKVKEFMMQKYEKKRWYVDPEVAVRRMSTPPEQTPETPKPPTTTTTPLGRSPAAPLVVHNSTPPQQAAPAWQSSSNSSVPQPPHQSSSSHQVKAVDLLSEFGGDPFGVTSPPPPPPPKSNNPVPAPPSSANGNFANFESAFSESAPNSATPSDSSANNTPPFGAFSSPAVVPTSNNPPSADRYAALADLDSLFHQATPPPANHAAQAPPPITTNSTWPVTSSVPSSYGGGAPTPAAVFGTASSNPFATNTVTTASWNTQQQQHQQHQQQQQQQQHHPVYAANPFHQPTTGGYGHHFGGVDNFPGYAPAPFVHAGGGPPNGAVLPQSFGVQNGNVGFAWGSTPMGWPQQGAFQANSKPMAANPFMGNAVLTAPRGNSSNPFL